METSYFADPRGRVTIVCARVRDDSGSTLTRGPPPSCRGDDDDDESPRNFYERMAMRERESERIHLGEISI